MYMCTFRIYMYMYILHLITEVQSYAFYVHVHIGACKFVSFAQKKFPLHLLSLNLIIISSLSYRQRP